MRNNESIQPMESRQALALSDYLIMRCLMFPRCVSRCLREFGRVFANTAVSNIANSGLRWIRCPTVFLCLVHAASEVSNCIATGMLCSLVARAAVYECRHSMSMVHEHVFSTRAEDAVLHWMLNASSAEGRCFPCIDTGQETWRNGTWNLTLENSSDNCDNSPTVWQVLKGFWKHTTFKHSPFNITFCWSRTTWTSTSIPRSRQAASLAAALRDKAAFTAKSRNKQTQKTQKMNTNLKYKYL